MGIFYNSSANIIYNIVNFLAIVASSAMVATIVYAVIKMMTSYDEGEHQRYAKRIKNGLIALILIFTLTPIVNLTQNYFYNNDEVGIGHFEKYADRKIQDSLDTYQKQTENTDSQGRQVITNRKSGQEYSKYYSSQGKNFGTWTKPCKFKVSGYILKDGASSNVEYYKIEKTEKIDDDYDDSNSYVGYYIPGNWKDTIGGKVKSQDDWEDLKSIMLSPDEFENGGSASGGGGGR